jgi:hypothetical protein
MSACLFAHCYCPFSCGGLWLSVAVFFGATDFGVLKLQRASCGLQPNNPVALERSKSDFTVLRLAITQAQFQFLLLISSKKFTLLKGCFK